MKKYILISTLLISYSLKSAQPEAKGVKEYLANNIAKMSAHASEFKKTSENIHNEVFRTGRWGGPQNQIDYTLSSIFSVIYSSSTIILKALDAIYTDLKNDIAQKKASSGAPALPPLPGKPGPGPGK